MMTVEVATMILNWWKDHKPPPIMVGTREVRGVTPEFVMIAGDTLGVDPWEWV